jgi:hypothetical protein
MHDLEKTLALAALLLCAAPAAHAGVTLLPTEDTTIYAEGGLSNGSGQHLIAGPAGNGVARRALLRFDVAAQVPAGATISAVRLELNLGNAQASSGELPLDLHRLEASWGESTSDAAGGEGGGAPAATGDATWDHRFFDTTLWTVPGGDFAALASGTFPVGPTLGPVVLDGTPGMLADVQAWLDAPASNFGWILISAESAAGTGRRFDSRDNPDVTVRPRLVIDFAPPGTQRFCDGADGSLASCPCANAGSAGSGCDVPQATGGVRLDVLCQETAPAAATLRGSGFAPTHRPTAVLLRANALDPARPVVIGDGLRCDSSDALVRLAATRAQGGVSQHVIGHTPGNGAGTFYYQVLYRSQPQAFCDAGAAFNLSDGTTLAW